MIELTPKIINQIQEIRFLFPESIIYYAHSKTGPEQTYILDNYSIDYISGPTSPRFNVYQRLLKDLKINIVSKRKFLTFNTFDYITIFKSPVNTYMQLQLHPHMLEFFKMMIKKLNIHVDVPVIYQLHYDSEYHIHKLFIHQNIRNSLAFSLFENLFSMFINDHNTDPENAFKRQNQIKIEFLSYKDNPMEVINAEENEPYESIFLYDNLTLNAK